MVDLKNISSVYFLGIGGIGMSALARYFNGRGIRVSGYDKTPTKLTSQLEQEGIAVHYTDDVNLADKQTELVVVTPAVPKDHTEYNYFLENGYPMLKRSEVLGMVTRDTFSVCVAGTHGKTTTSSMIAHIFRDSGKGCNAFLGGIASNYETNFWSSEQHTSVAEADEYDRSFLQLNPDIAVITSMDPDHLDIYGTKEKLEDAFIEFASRIKKGGWLISKYGLTRSQEFKASNMMQYSLQNEKADVFAENIQIKNGSYLFDTKIGTEVIKGVALNMGGMHNIENAVAAIAVTKQAGINEDDIKKAVSGFRGVKRRFEYLVKTKDTVMIDDYAHHPEELRALITGAMELFPGKKCTIVFQPHLFSRTKDFADGFAEVLGLADEVYLLPIYPARELPMEGVDSGLVGRKMKKGNARLVSKDDLVVVLKNNKPELLITAGAGDIDMMLDEIREIMTNKN